MWEDITLCGSECYNSLLSSPFGCLLPLHFSNLLYLVTKSLNLLKLRLSCSIVICGTEHPNRRHHMLFVT